MNRFIQAFCSIGSRREVKYTAPTQVVMENGPGEKNGLPATSIDNVATIMVLSKVSMMNRWLNAMVRFSGSQAVFFGILIILLTWAFLGIPFGTATNWQVGISDGQAILNLVFDSFLMRQQFIEYEHFLMVSCCLRSRAISHQRMLRQLAEAGKYRKLEAMATLNIEQTEFASELPPENLLGRICTSVSNFLGHIITAIGFWVGIFIWIGFGASLGWSSTWLFYMNSATSALMVFILAFLANIRERHSKYTAKCLESIHAADTALELRLRAITEDTIENPSISIAAPPVSRVQRGINFYADLVGTLLGIALLCLVLLIWLFLGPAMSFDPNWWLLIGTYAGLIGMNDGFVLQNVNNQIAIHVDAECQQQFFNDADLLALIGVTQLEQEQVADKSFSCRISTVMGHICSHQWTVVVGALSIVGLIVGATGMGWSVTGQLLCNVPPSIIESFFTMILITGHNIGYARRRVDLHNIYLRRLRIICHLKALVEVE